MAGITKNFRRLVADFGLSPAPASPRAYTGEGQRRLLAKLLVLRFDPRVSAKVLERSPLHVLVPVLKLQFPDPA